MYILTVFEIMQEKELFSSINTYKYCILHQNLIEMAATTLNSLIRSQNF